MRDQAPGTLLFFMIDTDIQIGNITDRLHPSFLKHCLSAQPYTVAAFDSDKAVADLFFKGKQRVAADKNKHVADIIEVTA